jgi:DNA-binding transcriptional MerR regulator
LRIGEAADQVAINPKTIRYYESIGLIPEADRTAGGYRTYGPDDVERLMFIRTAQRLGLTLDEIREVLAFRERGEQPCRYVLEAVHRQTQEIDRQVRELLEVRDELEQLTARAEEADDGTGRYCRLLEGSHPGTAGSPARP